MSTLDCMRAMSVVIVVGIHYGAMSGHLPGALHALARVVVLMFFVHTSFVLMSSLERQQARSPGALWRRFMLGRLLRVYPLALFVLTAIVVFSIPSRIVPPGFEYLKLGTAAMVSNFLLTMNLTASPPLLSPMWSLPYEFQLYCLLPALFRLVSRSSGAAPAFAIWCAGVLLAVAQPLLPNAGRLDILEFLPCIAAGILCYQLSKIVEPCLPFAWWPAMLAACMCIGGLAWATPGNWAMAAGHWPMAWIACLLAAITAPFVRQARNSAVRGVLHWVAQRSYAIYLSHYFCLWLAFRANDFAPLEQWAIFAAAMTAVPMALYEWIETPMIRLGHALTGGGAASSAPAAWRALASCRRARSGRLAVRR